MKKNKKTIAIAALAIALHACSAEIKTQDGQPLINGNPFSAGNDGNNAAPASSGISLEGNWSTDCVRHDGSATMYKKSTFVGTGSALKTEMGFYSDASCANLITNSGLTLLSKRSGNVKFHEDFTGRPGYAIIEYHYTDDQGSTDYEYFMVRLENGKLSFGESSSSKVAVSEPDTSFPYKKQ